MTTQPHPEDLDPLVIEPCQFCGSNKVEIYTTPIAFKPGRRTDAWVGCRPCGASGPVGGTPEQAVDFWNLGKPAEKQEGTKS